MLTSPSTRTSCTSPSKRVLADAAWATSTGACSGAIASGRDDREGGGCGERRDDPAQDAAGRTRAARDPEGCRAPRPPWSSPGIPHPGPRVANPPASRIRTHATAANRDGPRMPRLSLGGCSSTSARSAGFPDVEGEGLEASDAADRLLLDEAAARLAAACPGEVVVLDDAYGALALGAAAAGAAASACTRTRSPGSARSPRTRAGSASRATSCR